MISKLRGTSCGYDISKATNEEFQGIIKDYPEKVCCIICNKNMARHFRIGLLGSNIITINNHVENGVIFINHFF